MVRGGATIQNCCCCCCCCCCLLLLLLPCPPCSCTNRSIEFRFRLPGADLWTDHKPAKEEAGLMFLLLGSGEARAAYAE